MYTGDDHPRLPRNPRDLREVRRLVDRMRASPLERRDLVDRIRERIREGLYENELKLDVAADRLLDDLHKRTDESPAPALPVPALPAPRDAG